MGQDIAKGLWEAWSGVGRTHCGLEWSEKLFTWEDLGSRGKLPRTGQAVRNWGVNWE